MRSSALASATPVVRAAPEPTPGKCHSRRKPRSSRAYDGSRSALTVAGQVHRRARQLARLAPGCHSNPASATDAGSCRRRRGSGAAAGCPAGPGSSRRGRAWRRGRTRHRTGCCPPCGRLLATVTEHARASEAPRRGSSAPRHAAGVAPADGEAVAGEEVAGGRARRARCRRCGGARRRGRGRARPRARRPANASSWSARATGNPPAPAATGSSAPSTSPSGEASFTTDCST